MVENKVIQALIVATIPLEKRARYIAIIGIPEMGNVSNLSSIGSSISICYLTEQPLQIR